MSHAGSIERSPRLIIIKNGIYPPQTVQSYTFIFRDAASREIGVSVEQIDGVAFMAAANNSPEISWWLKVTVRQFPTPWPPLHGVGGIQAKTESMTTDFRPPVEEARLLDSWKRADSRETSR